MTSAAGDQGYDDARRVWTAMIDRRPALIARCRNVSDVDRGLRFASERNLAVTVRRGGHDIGGRALTDGTLVVDTLPMRVIPVHPIRRVAELPWRYDPAGIFRAAA